MKQLLFLLLLVPGHRYEAQQIKHEEYKLNSGSRPGGTSRALVKLQIPAHTDYLVYTVAASPSNPLHDLGLHSQLRERTKVEGANLSVGSTLLNKLTLPSADGVTDVFIIADSAEATRYSRKIDEPHYSEDYSRQHIANAIVGIPIKYSKRDTVLYMVLRNPEAFQAEYVSVEVVAMKRL
jgi:hypothetical protein